MLETYKATIEVLDEIRTRTKSKYGFKPLISIELYDYWKDPTWYHQTVKIGYNHEPEAIAHELGHGHEEIIREKHDKSEQWGEHFGQAIRYYVEKEKLFTGSKWLIKMDEELAVTNSTDMQDVRICSECGDLATYITQLSDDTLLNTLLII